MINLAVINLKDIIKFFIKLFFIIIIIIIIFNVCNSIRKGNYVKVENLRHNIFSTHTEIMDKTIILSKYFNSPEISSQKESGIKKILVSELAIFGTEEELMEKENQEEVTEFEDVGNNNQSDNTNAQEIATNVTENITNIEEVPGLLPTKVIEENNKIDKYTDTYKSVKIKNESKYTLTQEMLTPDVDFTNKKDIIIYHSHTCESYTPTENMPYLASGNFRTTDLNYSVARVGTELTNYLTLAGFNVNHNTTYHDYPAYTGSYTRSLATINNILANNDAQFVIDLHRDALGSNSSYAPSVQIGDEVAAQVMFVMRNRWR